MAQLSAGGNVIYPPPCGHRRPTTGELPANVWPALRQGERTVTTRNSWTKTLLAVAAFLPFSIAPIPALAQAQVGPGAAEDGALTAQAAWLQAYANSDETALVALLADDFTIVVSTGELLDKAHLLQRAKQPPVALTMARSEASLRRQGPFAIVTSKVTEQRGPNQLQFRVTDVLVLKGPGWQLASSHWTRTAGDLTAIKLPAAALDRFAGTYLTPRRVPLHVSRAGGQLRVTEPGGQTTELIALSPTLFASKSGHVRWLFITQVPGASGHAVIANQNVLTLLTREPRSAE